MAADKECVFSSRITWRHFFPHSTRIFLTNNCSFFPILVLNGIPDVSAEKLPPYDYIVVVTKNCPDIAPCLTSVVAPALTPGHTVIVLIQNGLNIEKPFFSTFPRNVVLSGVSMIDSHEAAPGHIMHEEADLLHLGAFHNPKLDAGVEQQAARDFVEIYGAAAKTDVRLCEDVAWARWRKLVFNACLNPICAITGLDDARIRLADGVVEGLVRPAMAEIMATARALGHVLPDDIADVMINLDPMDLYLKPSMQCDIEKVCHGISRIGGHAVMTNTSKGKLSGV